MAKSYFKTLCRSASARLGQLLGCLFGVLLCACSGPQIVSAPSPQLPATARLPEVRLEKLDWAALPGWKQDDLQGVWAAWQQNCKGLAKRTDSQGALWARLCGRAANLDAGDAAQIRQFIENNFDPHRLTLITDVNGASSRQTTGLITGYYEPVYRGSKIRTAPYSAALYAPPKDLINVELASLYPELKGQRVRGRLIEDANGLKLLPYLSRAEIAQADTQTELQARFSAQPLVWLEPLDAFFIEVQGAGRIELADGSQMRVGYANQNGHPYKSIGRWLVEQGELTLEQASAQNIRAWAQKNPGRLQELLNANPSQVFFREPKNLAASDGPLGALGVPLVAQRSIAVDPKFIPLGALLFLDTSYPNSGEPLQRLVFAQDTGGAIRGAIRADYYWGTGPQAGEQAGRMRQQGGLYLLLPGAQ